MAGVVTCGGCGLTCGGGGHTYFYQKPVDSTDLAEKPPGNRSGHTWVHFYQKPVTLLKSLLVTFYCPIQGSASLVWPALVLYEPYIPAHVQEIILACIIFNVSQGKTLRMLSNWQSVLSVLWRG